MSASLLPDDLWTVVQPLLPPEPPKPKGGRPRVPDQAALTTSHGAEPPPRQVAAQVQPVLARFALAQPHRDQHMLA